MKKIKEKNNYTELVLNENKLLINLGCGHEGLNLNMNRNYVSEFR